jgi:hypothetical protein
MEFEQTIKKIQKAYAELGHVLGYRFLLSSKNTFSSDILFLNLNPAGRTIPPDHPSDSCETGPAHLTESWKNGHAVGMSPLQIQVQRMFAELSKRIPGNRNLINEALIAYFIPFRSPRIEDLHAKEKSISFAIELWSEILASVKPKLIICLGNDVYKNIRKLFPDTSVIFNTNIGWNHGKGGGVTAQVCTYNNGCRILKLPHLSTYKIFSRYESKPYIDRLLNEATKNW